MKKTIFLLVILSLVTLPMAANAAVSAPTKPDAIEFTLGGYIKMEVIWDSTQVNKNLLQFIPRNNNPDFHHGRLKFTAENSRMSFTIKGPKLWGAQTSGYIEWDFDNHANEYIFTGAPGGGWASPEKARIGLRHAIFRLNWPDTELMMGQYWSVLTEEIPETANFGAGTTGGQPFLREPQIRLTQTFGLGTGKMMASIALAEPSNGLWGLALNGTQSATNPYGGESSETPKVEGRLKYDIDLWGKAAFWGVPRPFSVRVGAAWWKERFRSSTQAGQIFGENNFTPVLFVSQPNQQYLDHWLVEGSVFIPLIPTNSANLAGTASLLTQWWVGAGLDGYFEDFPGTASYLNFDYTNAAGARVGDRELLQRFGGFVQLQYYFTNQWYANAMWGMNRAFNVDRDRWMGDTVANDPVRMNQHYYLTLWYRPIQALKFGLEYTYVKTGYFQNQGRSATGGAGEFNPTHIGENHRVMFCGFFFF
jgi:hypothetical protein